MGWSLSTLLYLVAGFCGFRTDREWTPWVACDQVPSLPVMGVSVHTGRPHSYAGGCERLSGCSPPPPPTHSQGPASKLWPVASSRCENTLGGRCESAKHLLLINTWLLKWSNSRKSANAGTNKEAFETKLRNGFENYGYVSDEPRTTGEWTGGTVERPREPNFEGKAWLARRQLHKADHVANGDHSFFFG